MAESGLSIGLPDLRKEVGFFLNYGTSGWSAAQQAEIDRYIQSGVRRVLYPPAVTPETLGYEWSWLRPTTTLQTVIAQGDYDLPDDFGRIVGDFHFPTEEYRAGIVHVSEGKILEERANANLTGAPYWYAIRWKATTGTTGQRQEVLFYPEPDTVWSLIYTYEAYQGALSDTYPYPPGGMKLAELYIESCLAVAESRADDEDKGKHQQQYEALLIDAISRDRRNGAKFYGNMGHHEDEGFEFRRGWGESTYPITYHGDTI